MGNLGKLGLRLSALAVLLTLIGPSPALAEMAPDDKDAPHYKVDPSWPKELPNNWIMGQIGGMTVDSHDHIWVLQRPRSATADELGAEQTPPRSNCCVTTPAVMEFDTEGNLIQAWGGPGHVPDWPKTEHGIWVDKQDNVWIAGNAPGDRHILKFTRDGKFLMEIGHPSTAPKNNQDTTMLGQPAGIQVDDVAHEIYVADGYLNNRVVVYDSQTGKFKRGWGAYGMKLSEVTNAPTKKYSPSDPIDKQFSSPVHCAFVSADGLVYVCDRNNNRIQVFTKQGKFKQEFIVRPNTLGNGSTWSLQFSHDPAQKYLLVLDGEDSNILIVRRSDGAIVSSFGHSGRNAGQFHWVHQATLDSKGNFYTGEVDSGKRIQKFILQN